jgi:pimeloyl-ACP methyl ester carboxylesterase
MFRPFFAQLVDEVVANVLLHGFLRRKGVRAAGPGSDREPGLYSGQLDQFYAPRPAAVDLARRRTFVRQTALARVYDLCYPSDKPLGWPESDRIWCRHWQALESGSDLTVVGVDGLVQLGSGWFRRLAERLNPHGIDVLMVDSPFNFRRTPRGYRPGQLIVSGDLAHQLAVTRAAVLDLWQVVESVARDGRRVGLVGVSYGGWLTLLTALLAGGLDFVIAVAPPVDIVSLLLEGGTIVRSIRHGLGSKTHDMAELSRVARPLVPSAWRPRLAPERITLHAARYDRFVSCRAIEELAAAWKTRIVVHSEAHYRLAGSPHATPLVAAEILDRESLGSSLRQALAHTAG